MARKAPQKSPAPSFMVRQGDVLIERIGAVPKNAVARARDNGRIILAYGEVTGHAHAIDDSLTDQRAAIYDDPSGNGFILSVESLTGVVHEEHGRIDLPVGTYRVTRQREYTPEAIRNVAD